MVNAQKRGQEDGWRTLLPGEGHVEWLGRKGVLRECHIGGMGKLIAPPETSALEDPPCENKNCTNVPHPSPPSVPPSRPRPRPARPRSPLASVHDMQPTGLSGWAPGQPTAVIDLGEEFAPDPSNASSAALQFSAAYYAVDSSAEGNGSKKRKVERACDFCRRRKARCDGPRMPDNVCSNCNTNARSCTYLCVPSSHPPPSSCPDAPRRSPAKAQSPEGLQRRE